MILRIIIDRQDHEVSGGLRVIHGLNDNYRQTRPEDHVVLAVGRVIHYLMVFISCLSMIIIKTMNHSKTP
jgi:hypothetical protein